MGYHFDAIGHTRFIGVGITSFGVVGTQGYNALGVTLGLGRIR
jgi:hypothetical protein